MRGVDAPPAAAAGMTSLAYATRRRRARTSPAQVSHAGKHASPATHRRIHAHRYTDGQADDPRRLRKLHCAAV